ncbi:Solute carrier family 13 member 3, partial [Ophiophagus hannah]
MRQQFWEENEKKWYSKAIQNQLMTYEAAHNLGSTSCYYYFYDHWMPLIARTGLLMNLLGICLLSLAINTWAMSIFQLGSFPSWANIHMENATTLLGDAQNITLNLTINKLI